MSNFSNILVYPSNINNVAFLLLSETDLARVVLLCLLWNGEIYREYFRGALEFEHKH